MADLFHVQVVLNRGESGEAVTPVMVPVMLDGIADGETIDAYCQRAEDAAVDALRPFLNNRTHLLPSVNLPVQLIEMPGTDNDQTGGDRG